MPADDTGDRTEDPTDRKRQEARQQGNVAHSTDLNSSAHMLAAACVLLFLGPAIFKSIGKLLYRSLSETEVTLPEAHVHKLFQELAEWGADTLTPTISLLLLIALASSISQVGFLFSNEALAPKFSRLDPIQGTKRLFQIQALVRLVASLLKIGVIVGLTVWYAISELDTFLLLSQGEIATSYVRIGESMIFLAFLLSTSLFVLGALDFAFQKWKHEQDLKMTKQEVRDEMKNMEGDPMIRARRREAHRKLAEARELQQVADSDVVITNPTHLSVALKYDPEKFDAPIVVAKGAGELAFRIREIAILNGVPIIERKPLARALYATVKVGQPIPIEMYGVFVEIMAYVYKISGKSMPNLSDGRGVGA